MDANLFAALLDGVPRYDGYGPEPCDDGKWLRLSDVLAALAAVPTDLAEAGKVLEGVTLGPWVAFIDDSGGRWTGWPLSVEAASITDKSIVRTGGHWPYEWDAKTSQAEAVANARFIAWCREGVPALLARIAAQEAQIKGLEAEKAGWEALAKDNAAQGAKIGNNLITRAETAETALAAERAKVARLVEALTPSGDTKAAYMGEFSIPFPTVDEDGNEVMLRPNVPWTTIKEIMAAIRARAAIAEAGQ